MEVRTALGCTALENVDQSIWVSAVIGRPDLANALLLPISSLLAGGGGCKLNNVTILTGGGGGGGYYGGGGGYVSLPLHCTALSLRLFYILTFSSVSHCRSADHEEDPPAYMGGGGGGGSAHSLGCDPDGLGMKQFDIEQGASVPILIPRDNFCV